MAIKLLRNGSSEISQPADTLQSRVQEYFFEELRRGNLTEGDRVPTIKEVADKLNVSTKVAFLAVKKMRDAGWFEKISHQKQIIARGAARLLMDKPLKLAFSSCGKNHILRGVYQAIFNHLNTMTKNSNTEITCLLEMDCMETDLSSRSYDVMIVSDWEPKDFRRFIKGPVIGIDTVEGLELDFVVKTDHFKGGKLAAEHLYARGSRSIIYWDLVEKESRAFKGMDYRRLGFQKSWLDLGGHISDIKVLSVLDDNGNVPSYLEHLNDADTYFFACDDWALQAWAEFKQKGVSVPEEVALMGFDGSYKALRHEPPLTTIEQPTEEIASRVLEIIAQVLLRGDNFYEKEILVPPKLYKGGST